MKQINIVGKGMPIIERGPSEPLFGDLIIKFANLDDLNFMSNLTN